MSFLSQVKENSVILGNLIFPPNDIFVEQEEIVEPFCSLCGEPFPNMKANTTFVCHKCQERKPSFTWARSVFMAKGKVRDAIHGFKYEGEYFQRRQLASWLELGFDRHAASNKWNALVPVPLHPLRYRERGFNQALELARLLGKSRGIKVLNCLIRNRETSTQTVLSKEERWRNLRKAFQWNRLIDVKGLHLLVIDDVYTTGATCDGCANILRRAGAASVAVLTVARS